MNGQNNSFKSLKFGEVISRVGVEKFKAYENQITVISIISDNVIGVKFHYSEDIGMFYCFEGSCCDDLGLPKARYVLPIVEYGTVRQQGQNNIEYDFPIALKYLIINKDKYTNLVTLKKTKGLNTFVGDDLLIQCTEERFQNFSFFSLERCKWREQNAVDQINVFNRDYERLIQYAVANVYDEVKYQELVQGTTLNSTTRNIKAGSFTYQNQVSAQPPIVRTPIPQSQVKTSPVQQSQVSPQPTIAQVPTQQPSQVQQPSIGNAEKDILEGVNESDLGAFLDNSSETPF